MGKNIKASIITGIFSFYKNILSPVLHVLGLTGNCRFSPTCSNYMREALLRYGIIVGFGLGLKRVFRCHPWSAGGYDPVPERHI